MQWARVSVNVVCPECKGSYLEVSRALDDHMIEAIEYECPSCNFKKVIGTN
jgi:rubredoxin